MTWYGRYGQATYAIVCREDQRQGRHSAMFRTRVFLVCIDAECPVLSSPARHYITDNSWPCPVLPGLVRFFLALPGPVWPCSTLFCPAWPRPALPDAARPSPIQYCSTLPCPSLSGSDRHCPALFDLVLPIPVHRYLSLPHCPYLPDPVRLRPAQP